MKIQKIIIQDYTRYLLSYSDKVSIKIDLVSKWTKNGFKHEGEVWISDSKNYDYKKAKICYLNRTWESYTYQSLIHKLIYGCKAIDPSRQKYFIKCIDKYENR